MSNPNFCQIERRIAPFWRGLDDFKEEWAEHQLVAAGRGLPIPAADEIPDENLTRPLSVSPHTSNHNLQNLMVPITTRSRSASSETASALAPSHPAFSNTNSQASTHSSSPFRPRSKTLASLSSSAKNPTTAEIVPREVQLAKDPYVNGQAIEVFLYKDSTECPICFLYYPPYLNKTRCCDQAICSECFVQIKRPEPHPPEHHDPSNPAPPPQDLEADPEALVSEPACCPYCQQPEFGVTYEPPPIKRGLAYANASYAVANFSSAMSSSSSLNSSAIGPPMSPSAHKRRTVSMSANNSAVITTDRVRPDWATKLSNARSHLARRAAAATALHTAAYLIGNGNTERGGFGFTTRSRFGRSRGDTNSPTISGAATPSPTADEARSVSDQLTLMRREAGEPGGSRRRGRMEDLEEMMMMEAIRLSLAAEEDRKRKSEKEAAKELKKKVKEDKKREKKERKVYGSGASSASASALSLSLPGIGRRRGNSGASNLQHEITMEDPASQFKGKGVDRNLPTGSGHSAPIDMTRGNSSTGIPGARHLDTATLASINDNHMPSPSPTAPGQPSHLRQMSNASSVATSFVESAAGSLRNEMHPHGSSSTLDSPNASGTLHTESTDREHDSNGGAGSEPMFNFRSLAAMIGQGDTKEDKEDAARHIEYLDGDESTTEMDRSVATLRNDHSYMYHSAEESHTISTPELTITPETPAAVNHGDDDGKQLGASWNEVHTSITQ